MRHYGVFGFVLLLTACQAFQNPAALLRVGKNITYRGDKG